MHPSKELRDFLIVYFLGIKALKKRVLETQSLSDSESQHLKTQDITILDLVFSEYFRVSAALSHSISVSQQL